MSVLVLMCHPLILKVLIPEDRIFSCVTEVLLLCAQQRQHKGASLLSGANYRRKIKKLVEPQ